MSKRSPVIAHTEGATPPRKGGLSDVWNGMVVLAERLVALENKPAAIAGRDGQPGRDGRDGRDGLDGTLISFGESTPLAAEDLDRLRWVRVVDKNGQAHRILVLD